MKHGGFVEGKIGVLGPKGRLGSHLVQLGCTPIPIDITDMEQIRTTQWEEFGVVINCAAMTHVDLCQIPKGAKGTPEYKRAVTVNAMALEQIRRKFEGRLIHLSTDYVFKGDNGPYKELSRRDPVNDYGYSKFGGEILLESYPFDKETVIVRTTGLYGSGEDFAAYVLRCLMRGEPIQASYELRGNQTYIPHLAQALLWLATNTLSTVVTHVHVGSREVISRCEFALSLARMFNLDEHLIEPVANRQIPNWVAPRPTRGGLLVDKALRMGVPVFSIQEGLNAYKETYHG